MIKAIRTLILSILLIAFNNLKSQSKPITKIEINQSHFNLDSDMKIIFTVTNITDDDYKFCFWQTPLEKSFSSDYFKITLDNKRIKYSGILIKRASPTETDYFLLKPKQSISEEINLKNSYMIDKKGKYKITFIGSSINQLPNSNQLEFIIN